MDEVGWLSRRRWLRRVTRFCALKLGKVRFPAISRFGYPQPMDLGEMFVWELRRVQDSLTAREEEPW